MSKRRLVVLNFASIAILAVLAGSAHPAWAAYLDAVISTGGVGFEISYPFTAVLVYEDGGNLSDALAGKAWKTSGHADSSHPDVREIIAMLNDSIAESGSYAYVDGLDVSYDFEMSPGSGFTSIDYMVEFSGFLAGSTLAHSSQMFIVDLGWRGLSLGGPVEIDGVDINIPINLLRDREPDAYEILAGTEAEDLLGEDLINADQILERRLDKWHFLFDQTVVRYNFPLMGNEKVNVSRWAMGDGGLEFGPHTTKASAATIFSDKEYVVKAVRTPDSAVLSVDGFAVDEVLGGVEFATVYESMPDYGFDLQDPSPGIVAYGMAGLVVVVAAAGFLVFRRRSARRKNKTRGIPDPASRQPRRDPACGCSASAEIGSECDCAMQDSCLCDGSCGCRAQVCRDHSQSML